MVLREEPAKMQMSPVTTSPIRTPVMSDKGYTLLELLVVISVIAMGIAIGPTIYSRLMPSYQMHLLADDLAGTVRSLRESARTDGVFSKIRVAGDARALLINGQPVDSPDGTIFEIQSAGPFGAADQNTINFYPGGTTDGGLIKFSREALVKNVLIDWASGAVEVKDGH